MEQHPEVVTYLEDDVACFKEALPRVRIIPIEDFDPLRYL